MLDISEFFHYSDDRDFLADHEHEHEHNEDRRLSLDEDNPISQSTEQDENEQHIGNILQEEKPQGIIRFYCINLNGLKWDRDGGNWPAICQAMKASNTDVIGLAELNHDVGRYELTRKLNSVCQATFQHHRLIMSTSNHKVCKTYKPGGTAALACNDMTALVKSWSRDRMGRWSSIRFSGAEGKHFQFIMAYQVGKSITKGTNTIAAQQNATIIAESAATDNMDRISPRTAFIRDLRQFIHAAQQTDDAIILCGDFNETIGENNSGMADLAIGCGLVDLFSLRLGDDTRPATYQRGRKRLDYVLLSPNLVPAVVEAGYDPFGYRVVSDHRGYFIDFRADALCGFSPTKLGSNQHRDFRSTDPRQLLQYIVEKNAYLQQHNWYERLDELMATNEPDNDTAEALDRDMVRASRTAANACRFSYRSPWSPKLAHAWAIVNFYKLAKSQAMNQQNDYSLALKRLQSQHPTLPSNVPTDLPEIATGYNNAVANLRLIRQQAQQLRDTFLQEQIAKYTALEESGKAHIVRRIRRAEAMSKVYQKIQFIRHPHGRNGLSKIKVPTDATIVEPNVMKELPDDDNHWTTVHVPEKIEKLLLERNQRHFGQAESTPFTMPPLSMNVRYNGTGIQAEAILEGEYDTASVSPATALFIQHLKQQSLVTLEGSITTEEILGKLQRWPERTTTSPSGLHLGHYHAMWRPTGLHGGSDDPEGQAIINAQESLQQGHTKLLQYALAHGYSYKRWSETVNVMLEKDIGNPRIHRLRIIHLYEADYNLVLAVKWRQALHHAEDTKLLNKGLYGSRPGRSASTPVQLEILQHAIYQLSMKTGIHLDLDATSCYDRILAKVASLSSRRMGMNSNVVLVNCTTLEQAKYRVKTTLGVSNDWYTHSEAFPIHGTGQGSGNSPTVWCFVCSVLFDALDSSAAGAVFISRNRKHTVRLCMIGFVDDCSQRVNRFDDHPQPSATALVEIMQREAQLWNDLLWASGGALEQSKCSYHIIESSWNNKGIPFLRATANAPPIILTNQGGQQVQLKRMSNYQAHRTLGCYIEPAMTMIKQTQVLHDKNNAFASLIRTNFLSRTEAWVMYTSVYLPAMTYPFPNIILTASAGEKLDQKFMNTIVPQCGYNRKMATAIRYAPHHFGGAGFRPLYIEWGCSVVLEMVKNLRVPQSYQGKMTVIALMWLHQYAGTSAFPLADTSAKIPPCPNRYFMAIRQFLTTIDSKIVLQEDTIEPPLRVNDKYIMDLVMQQTWWSNQRVECINACRRYLQATTLADITTARGTEIAEDVWNGTRIIPKENYRGVMFNQVKPNDIAWGYWRGFLRTLCHRQRHLHVPLGNWTTSITEVRHPTQWVYQPQADTLYRQLQGYTYQEVCTRQRPGLFTVPHNATSITHPPGYPTWVLESSQGFRPMHAFCEAPLPPPRPSTFEAYIQCLDSWEKALLEHSSLSQPPAEVMHRLNAGPITCASDGSVKKTSATFGFVICDENQERLVRGRGPVTGYDPTSLRSEAYGGLAVCRLLIRLSQFTGINLQSPVLQVVDSQSLIQRVSSAQKGWHDDPSSCLKPEWDVIHEIISSMSQLPHPPKYEWVKGHQDMNRAYESLDHKAQMNCDADSLATLHHRFMPHSPNTVNITLPSNPVEFQIGSASISHKYKSKIRTTATLPALRLYLCKRFDWHPISFDDIAWASFYQIIKQFRQHHLTIAKHIHSIAPTGHIAHRNQQSLSAKCPSCECIKEDNNHVIVCPAVSRAAWRSATLDQINSLQEDRSDPFLKYLLQEGLRRFHHQLPNVRETEFPPRYHALIRQQNALGWDQLYRGRWSNQWSLLHSQHATHLAWSSQERDGDRWVVLHGRKLMERWLVLWNTRNTERHGADMEEQHRARTVILHQELQALYSLRQDVHPLDRGLFYPTSQQHLLAKPNLDAIENWILTHRSAITASVAQARRHGIARNQTIDQFFTRRTDVLDGETNPRASRPQ